MSPSSQPQGEEEQKIVEVLRRIREKRGAFRAVSERERVLTEPPEREEEEARSN